MNNLIGKVAVTLKVIFAFKNWPQLLAKRLFPNGKDSLFILRNGTKIFGGEDSTNVSVISEVFVYDAYFRHLQEEPKTIIDIGANVGYFTVHAAAKFPQAKIYSFEPFPKSYQKLERHVKENNFTNITTVNKAISDREGTASLILSTSVGEHSLVLNNSSGNTVSVQCTTLSDVLNEFAIDICDFLKIDCEGSEYDIIYTFPKMSFSRIKNIAIETHFLDNKAKNEGALAAFLQANGFEVIQEQVGVCPFIFAKFRN